MVKKSKTAKMDAVGTISSAVDDVRDSLKSLYTCDIEMVKTGLRKNPEFAHETDVGLDMYPTEVELVAFSGNKYKIMLCDNLQENERKIIEAEKEERRVSSFCKRLKSFINGDDYRLGWKKAKFNTGIAIAPDEKYFICGVANSRITKGDFILQNCIGIIDPTYRGNIGLFYYNMGNGFCRDSILPLCNCCGQIFPAIRIKPIIKMVERLSETERGIGGFGSSVK